MTLSCRWLSYHQPVEQHVPARDDGRSHHPQVLENGYCMPDGYVRSDVAASPARRSWTKEPLQIKPITWHTDNCLKYTAAEVMARGRQAERITARSTALGGTQTAAATKRELLSLGVKGLPLFSTLSYFKCVSLGHADHCLTMQALLYMSSSRCVGTGRTFVHMPAVHLCTEVEHLSRGITCMALFHHHGPLTCSSPCVPLFCSPLHFFRLGTAHILLLGLVKDFWIQFLPRPHELAARTGVAAEMVLPKVIRRAMEQKLPFMQATSGVTKPYVDVVGYDP